MKEDIFVIVLPVFLVIGLGFSLKRTGLVNSDFILSLNRLIYYIALPALLFYKIGTADFITSFNGPLLGGLVISVLIVFIISYLYRSLRGYPPSVHGTFCQGAFRGNLAYIGLAIVYNAYGEKGFAIAGILLGFIVPLFNFLSVVALLLPNRHGGYRMGILFWVKQIGSNPLILASFGGLSGVFLRSRYRR